MLQLMEQVILFFVDIKILHFCVFCAELRDYNFVLFSFHIMLH